MMVSEIPGKPKCFVVLPRESVGPRSEVRKTVLEALQQAGVQAGTTDDVEAGANQYVQTMEELESANFLIADVSDPNPNIMYVVGFAHAIRKHTILVRSAEAVSPSLNNLALFFQFVYDPKDLRKLHDFVQLEARRRVKAMVDGN